jgi:hypothetical protein
MRLPLQFYQSSLAKQKGIRKHGFDLAFSREIPVFLAIFVFPQDIEEKGQPSKFNPD